MEASVFNLEPPPGFRGLDPNLPLQMYHRHLPHWRQDGASYFVTFRLNDALPQEKINELQQMKREWEAAHPSPRSSEEWHKFAQDVSAKEERWLDEGYGSCLLADPANSKLLADGLAHFNQQRYL